MKSIITVTLMVLCTVLAKGQGEYFTSTHKTDGISTDWTENELTVDEKTGFITGVKNDGVNLYLIFKSKKQSTTMKAMQAGMTLTLKAKSKPKINARIDFPLPGDRAAMGGFQGGNRQGGQSAADREAFRNEMMRSMLASKNELKLKGFSKTEGNIGLDQLESFQVGLAIEGEGQERSFNYEVTIPLTEIYGESFDRSKASATPLEIEFDVKAMSAPSQGGGGAGMSGAGGGGGRGGAGGGGGRGGAGGAGGFGGGAGGGSSRGGGEMFSSERVKFDYSIKP